MISCIRRIDCIYIYIYKTHCNLYLPGIYILSIIIIQGAIATTMTQPVDVIKTRAMNAKPGEFRVSTVIDKLFVCPRMSLIPYAKHNTVLPFRKKE